MNKVLPVLPWCGLRVLIDERSSIMATMGELGGTSTRSLPEALTRTLRHEVGDLLQTIYAAVAILQKRLPPESAVERRVLADLRSRAESCKHLLDNLSDLVSPLRLSFERVDLAQLATTLVAAAAARYPQLEIRAEPSAPVSVPADEKRIAQVGEILLAHACEGAHRRAWFRTGERPAGEGAEWAVMHDGPGVPTEQLEELFMPFGMICHGNPGIRLALAQRLVLLHGGRIAAENLPAGGFGVRVWLPSTAPAQTMASTK